MLPTQRRISAPAITYPNGGGAIAAVSEKLSNDPFTGSLVIEIPVPVSPARGFEPALSLTYHSGSGNDIFGMGFNIFLPGISCRTSKGLPRYNGTDHYVLDNSHELTPYIAPSTGKHDKRKDVIGGITYLVRRYTPLKDTDFPLVESWTDDATGIVFWKKVTRDNITCIYGQTANARIADPSNDRHIFQWLIEEMYDAKGNKIQFLYKEDNAVNRPALENVNTHLYGNKYIERIRYGNYFDASNTELYAFENVFVYGDINLADPKPDITQLNDNWNYRNDAFSTYRSGFEIRTTRLCKYILLYHTIESPIKGFPYLVKSLNLQYREDTFTRLSLLASVTLSGHRITEDGTCIMQVTPSLQLEYTLPDPGSQVFRPLTNEYGQKIKGQLGMDNWSMTDLYSEGLPGILFTGEPFPAYCAPAGHGTYFNKVPLKNFPSLNPAAPSGALVNIFSGDRSNYFINQPPFAGSFEQNNNQGWSAYRTLTSIPFELANPFMELVDLTGDGCADMLMMTKGKLAYYQCIPGKGFAAAEQLSNPGLPIPVSSNPNELIFFSDMTGDGLADLVRIRNGLVEYWPNTGYGHFGNKMTMADCPVMTGEMNSDRIFPADINGSGTTDIVIVYPDHIEIYFNQQGNSFSSPCFIPVPQRYTTGDIIFFADIMGAGTSSLVLGKAGHVQQQSFFDFCNGIKPFLLSNIDNNLGNSSSFSYCSSTQFYLDDKKANQAWLAPLPFPVQTICKIETKDLISGVTQVNQFKYHEGYYDDTLREFAGFGYIEQWDSLTSPDYQSFAENPGTISFTLAPDEISPAAYTRLWFHTGSYADQQSLSKQFESKYFHGDALAITLPDSVIKNATDPDATLFSRAAASLKGKLLRTEVYGLDGSNVQQNPYSVSEYNYTIQLVQENEGNKPVFHVYPRERLTYNYERDPADPRISHEFTLEADQFGNITSKCEISYARRDPVYKNTLTSLHPPEQATPKILLYSDKFINHCDTSFYLLDIPAEQQAFELSGLTKKSLYFNFDEVKNQAAQALGNEIQFQQPFSAGKLQARLLSWQQYYYWNEAQTLPLPLGGVTPLALLHHIEHAVVSPDDILNLFGNLLPDTTIANAGYLLKTNADPVKTYWWNQGYTEQYGDSKNFFQSTQLTSALGECTKVTYDLYSLNLIEVAEVISVSQQNITRADIDYFALKPLLLRDENDNITQIRYDPLGNISVSSLHSLKFGKWTGDGDLKNYKPVPASIEAIIASPSDFLQDATGYYYYDPGLWSQKAHPAMLICLERFTHVSDLQPGEKSAISISITYYDGGGRILEKKILASGLKNDDDVSATKWIAKERVMYNNKSEPLRQYKPFYSDDVYFETEAEAQTMGAVYNTLLYDALGRIIRIYTPKADIIRAFFSKKEYAAWLTLSYDQDDTVTESEYFKQYINSPDPEIREALEKAKVFYNTPDSVHYSVQGFTFKQTSILTSTVEPAHTDLTTLYGVDCTGQVISGSDPRLLASGTRNIAFTYDMDGRVMRIESADAGKRLQFFNIGGNTVFNWSSDNIACSYEYDNLQRLTALYVTGNNPYDPTLNQYVEKIIYGEGQAGDKDNNLRGNIFRHYDQAGLLHYVAYNMANYATNIERRILKDYTKEPDWSKDDAQLQDEIFATLYTYDALGNLLSRKNADGSRWKAEYNLQSWPDKVAIDMAGNLSTIVSSVDYAATGQRLSVEYGNNVRTEFTLEKGTFYLSAINTRRLSDQQQLQNSIYYYDPQANLTSVIDTAPLYVFCTPPVTNTPGKYEYDSLYRLIKNSGREAAVIKEDTYKDGFKQTIFLPLCPVDGTGTGTPLSDYTEKYLYDKSGNLIRFTHEGSFNWDREMEIATNSNRGVLKEMLSPGKVIDDFFDKNGNLVNMENLATINWNYRNNIAGANAHHNADDHSCTDYYQYDSNGNRIRKVVEVYSDGKKISVEDTIYVDQLVICITTDLSNEETVVSPTGYSQMVSDGTQVVAIISYSNTVNDTTPGFRYQFDNNIGSSCLELDESAKILSYEEYYPFGGSSFITGDSEELVEPKDFRYSFEECDDSTGMYYYGERYYATWAARWMCPDPAWDINGLNVYVFVEENPMTSVDEMGEGKVYKINYGAGKKGGKIVMDKVLNTHTVIYKPKPTNSGVGISRRYPVSNAKYRSKTGPHTPVRRVVKTMFSSLKSNEIGFVRGHMIPHADTDTSTPAGAPAGYKMSTLDVNNYYPEPEGWGEQLRKRREEKARRRGTPIIQRNYLGSQTTNGGFAIPTHLYFIEIRGESTHLPASEKKPYNVKAYRLNYAGFDYDKLPVKKFGSDRRVMKSLRVNHLPADLMQLIKDKFPGFTIKL